MLDRYVRENIIALEVFSDDGQSEFNGVDGRTLHAFARRGLVWFEAVDPFAKSKRYRGGLTDKGRAVLAEHEAAEKAASQFDSRSAVGAAQFTEADVIAAAAVHAEHVTGYSMRDGGYTYRCGRCTWAASGPDAAVEAQRHRMREALAAITSLPNGGSR
ncbi:hypothetical protein FM104_12570 [Microbacterium esteraromaticum]|uniref:Uncharacterized protein n=1 Tax=Microbacterium esteraromaticum TaxID=57043 RepID=A0A1R4KH07_9MICO|nr:hypothetical protein [Microbacterium esteraromaticum]SJN43333.1 hypothetical protein FM104_12570 [Microbacterium esteraromaticum]